MNGHIVDRLSAYVDGELRGSDRARVEGHLKECGECARRLEELMAVDAMARALPIDAPEAYFDTFASRVRDRLQVEGVRAPVRPWRMPVWGWAAAAALILAVLTPLIVQKPRPAPTLSDDGEVALQELPAVRAPAPAEEPQAPAKLRASAGPVPAQPTTVPPASAPMPLPRPQLAPTAAPEAQGRRELQAGKTRSVDDPKYKRDDFQQQDKPSATVPAPPSGERSGGAYGFAPPPAPAAPPPPVVGGLDSGAATTETFNRAAAKKAEAEAKMQEEATANELLRADADGRAASAGAKDEQRVPAAGLRARSVVADEGSRFRDLVSQYGRTAQDARALREAWRVFNKTYPKGSYSDEARVRVIQLGIEAFRLGGDAKDRDKALEDAALYLRRADAAQAERVKALLNTLD
jgi:hypothetical protein